MAEDDRTIPTPKRGAVPTPREVIEDAIPYEPDKAGEADTSSEPPDTPAPPDEKPDEREQKRHPDP